MNKLHLAIVLAVFCVESFAQTTEPLEAARQAMIAGHPARAVELLQPLEEEQAGNITYDYLLGLARLDSGDPERAVFAFERVLAMQPEHIQARAEIGRAYLMLGEKEAGVKELKAVSANQIPDEARKTIERYLSLFGAGPTRLSGYLEASLGYDTNINSAVNAGQLAIPSLGNALSELSKNARSQEGLYQTAAGGVNFSHPLDENWSIVGGAAINLRYNDSYKQFDTRSLEGNAGVRYATGAHAFTMALQAQTFEIEHDRNREASGVLGQWQYLLDRKTQVSLFAQHIKLRYPSLAQAIRDADRSIGGFAFARVMDGVWSPSLFASIYAGEERETHNGAAHFGHKPVGVRFGGQVKPTSSSTWFANVSFENRRYGGSDPLFQVARKDHQLDFRAGLNYEPARYWIVSPQVSYTRNDSNVALSDYARNTVSITVRREF